MKIDNNYSIENDESNFKLVEIRIKGENSKNSGEERAVVLGYYGYLDAALKGYMKYALRNDLPKEAEAVLLKLNEIELNIETFCKKLSVFKGNDINLKAVEDHFGES
jgi:hypothetical protein